MTHAAPALRFGMRGYVSPEQEAAEEARRQRIAAGTAGRMQLPKLPTLRALDRADEGECNLVLSGWQQSYTSSRKGGPLTESLPKNLAPGVEASVFYRLCQPVIKDLIARSTIVCAVAEEGFIYGWMAWEGDYLHYINVKPKWMRLGIATWMLHDFLGHAVEYTHRTTDGMRLRESMVAGMSAWSYAPMRRFKEAA